MSRFQALLILRSLENVAFPGICNRVWSTHQADRIADFGGDWAALVEAAAVGECTVAPEVLGLRRREMVH